ncbi:Hypothetical protein XFF4834R_chr03610 [Xanthomonas citri pv. fuscans]|nr:Hypothetical protein XFF4834R_chr03610 [Xanthomonas citri pv. fuscans]
MLALAQQRRYHCSFGACGIACLCALRQEDLDAGMRLPVCRRRGVPRGLSWLPSAARWQRAGILESPSMASGVD